jgi:hypothetical protein
MSWRRITAHQTQAKHAGQAGSQTMTFIHVDPQGLGRLGDDPRAKKFATKHLWREIALTGQDCAFGIEFKQTWLSDISL